MPLYAVELEDGRKFQVDADGPPNEADIEQHIQAHGVLVNDRPRLENNPNHQPGLNLQGNEQPNARAIGPLSWPMEVIESGASAIGNTVLDPRYGILNKVLQGVGLTGFPKAQMEFGSPEYAQGQPTPIKPLFSPGQPIVTGQFANEDTDPVDRVVGNLLRGFTTPGSVLTLGAGKILGAPKTVMGLFGGPMVEHAPESTAQAASKAGDYFGTPPEQRTIAQKDAMTEAGLNEVANKIMLGGIGYGLTRPGPLIPDVLPPLQEPPPFQPLNRRLANNTYIDADVTGQKLLTEGQKQIGFPSMAEALAKVAESLPEQGRADAASLGASAKMMPGEGQSSGEMERGLISEDGKERAVAAAIRLSNGEVYEAPTHGQAYDLIPESKRGVDKFADFETEDYQLFRTNKGRLVSRDEAGELEGVGRQPTAEELNLPETPEFRRQMEEQQKQSGSTKEQDIPIEDRGSAGGNLSSFGFLDPAFWKQQLGIASEAKTDAVQLYNRVRNKLGERSAGWEMLNTPEFKAFMVGTRTPSEVEKWVNENGPKVEIHAYGMEGKDVAPPKVEAQTPMVRAGQKVSPSMVTGKVPEKMSQLMRAYNLPEDASYAEVAKTHRERAKSLHPDRGGSADAMAHENAMFDAIEDKMVKQVVRGQREMEEGLVPAADKAIAELKDAIEAKRAGKVSEKYGPADAHTLERWQLALQNAVKPFKAKGITITLGTPESGALNMTVVKDAVKMAGASIKSAGQAVRWYSEPLVERLGRMGGPVSKMVSEAGGQIISRQKMYYGRLTPLIDPAKKAMGRPNTVNMWMRKLHQYNDRAAVNNMFAQNEGTVPVNPAASRETALLNRANLAVGHLATLATPGFVPTNKLQRMLTSYGVDVVRRGGGPAWEAWTKGVAQANGKTLISVQQFFRRWKAEMDEPTSDVAALNSINQDFTRFYPKSVTHIKPGMAWHEVIIADPFAYLEGSAQRTATAVAFREVFPAGSRMLQQTRKMVQAELKTDTQGTEFDNLIRALQGHPTDTFVSTITAPDTWAGGGMRMLSQVVGTPLKSLMLTGNAATNIGEVIVGGPAIFFGYRNALPAVLRLPYGYAQLELNGQVNRALQNYAYDPSSPMRSLTRAVSGGIRSITFQQALNELQEAHAAMSASVVTERILAHNFSPTEGENFVAAMRGMGMTEANARRALAGDRELLSQFERRAAASLTSGHVSMAERSRAGTSRAFNELFWFHSYPQMTLNQVRKVMENLAEDVQNRNTRQMAANAKLLGRLIAGRTMQGAITAGIYALVFGGLFGLAVKKKEAKDDLGKFLLDSYIGGLGGPAAIGKRLIEQGGDSKTLAANVAALSTPVSAASDLYDLSMGNGRYEGRRAFERVGMFIESKTPAAKMLQTGMALYGLSEGDPKLDASMKAFYRWRREEKGWKTSTSEGNLEEDKQFRAQMRRVVEKLQSGGDWQSELKKVSDTGRAGKSLFARTLLRDQNGKGLSEEDMGLLRKHIGDEAVNLLQARDSMIRQIARELGVSEGDVSKINSKPLGLAVDAMSQGKRIERIQDQLAPDVSDWLTKNKLHLTDISPSRKIAGRQSDLDVPSYTRLEGAAVQEYNQAIQRLMLSPTFQSAPTHEKQERLNKALDLAEKRAKRMSR